MPLEPIHVMEMDRSTSRLELTHINPTKQYARWTGNGVALYIWQNGQWYDTGQNPVDPADVPAEYRADIATNPPRVIVPGAAAVTWTCRFCGESMNSSEQEEHLLAHVDATMKAAGAVTVPAPAPEPTPRGERRSREA